jgi:hypothetical protein
MDIKRTVTLAFDDELAGARVGGQIAYLLCTPEVEEQSFQPRPSDTHAHLYISGAPDTALRLGIWIGQLGGRTAAELDGKDDSTG